MLDRALMKAACGCGSAAEWFMTTSVNCSAHMGPSAGHFRSDACRVSGETGTVRTTQDSRSTPNAGLRM